jgi:hypothetical protein
MQEYSYQLTCIEVNIFHFLKVRTYFFFSFLEKLNIFSSLVTRTRILVGHSPKEKKINTSRIKYLVKG